jgi:hypothetical protein
MGTLYNLTAAYQQLAEKLEGCDEQTQIDTLEGSAEFDNIEQKAAGICKMLSNWQGDISVLDKEINRLTSHKRTMENSIKSVKEYLKQNMEALKLDKIKVGTFSISLQNSPAALSITDDKLLPVKYWEVIPQSFKPMNDKIKQDLKNGIAVPGATLTTGKSLRIR